MSKNLSQTSVDKPRSRKQENSPRLSWDDGTAYDFFLSLEVLHKPEKYGLRASWAAGVRSRLSLADRKTLETAVNTFFAPVHWIYNLPAPKDSTGVLRALRQIPAEERLPLLGITPDTTPEIADILLDVAERGQWQDEDIETLRAAYRFSEEDAPRQKALVAMLDTWSRPMEFGENFLAALESYQRAFFAEEERHSASVLKESLKEAQELAQHLSLHDLIEHLSQGVHLEEVGEISELVLAPSYWISPFIILTRVAPDRLVMVYGGRPPQMSLVPGEQVPDMLLRVLKASADPTRLRILHYLTQEPLTPAQLSRRLRLRAPTVIHHLNALRLAGLVHVTLVAKDERRYAARLEGIDAMFSNLKEFLESGFDK